MSKDRQFRKFQDRSILRTKEIWFQEKIALSITCIILSFFLVIHLCTCNENLNAKPCI